MFMTYYKRFVTLHHKIRTGHYSNFLVILFCTQLQVYHPETDCYLPHETVTLAREKYYNTYKEEMELNEAFHKFVGNFKSAYEGRNTRGDQIIVSKKKYSDMERKLFFPECIPWL